MASEIGVGGGVQRVSTGSTVLRRLFVGVLLLTGASVLVAIVAASVGPFTIPFTHTATTLLELVGIGESTAKPTEQAIIQSIRLPRIFLAFIVGAALGISGGIMQGLFRNSMADPGIIGVSSGGATGAVVAIATGASTVSTFFLPLFAFIGSGGFLGGLFFFWLRGGGFFVGCLLFGGGGGCPFFGGGTSRCVSFCA